MSVDVVIIAEECHPLSLTSSCGEELHAVEVRMVWDSTGIPVKVCCYPTCICKMCTWNSQSYSLTVDPLPYRIVVIIPQTAEPVRYFWVFSDCCFRLQHDWYNKVLIFLGMNLDQSCFISKYFPGFFFNKNKDKIILLFLLAMHQSLVIGVISVRWFSVHTAHGIRVPIKGLTFHVFTIFRYNIRN